MDRRDRLIVRGVRPALIAASCLFAGFSAAEPVFDRVFEPSGATWLGSDEWLVVDDEPERAMRRFGLAPDASHIVAERSIDLPDGMLQRMRLGPLDDLEGACTGASGRLYVIGSHNSEAGVKSANRRKLISFELDDDRMSGVQSRRDLRKRILDRYPVIEDAVDEGGRHDNDLDIEALACDHRRDRLLIGLRSPRVDNDAVIVVIDNPAGWMQGNADAALAAQPLTLDLDKGGIRAMSYDSASDRVLIVSRRESGGGSAFKLWHIDAAFDNEPERIKLDDKDAFDNVEGIALSDDGVLFVRDDGERSKGRGGSWFFLTKDALGIDGDLQ